MSRRRVANMVTGAVIFVSVIAFAPLLFSGGTQEPPMGKTMVFWTMWNEQEPNSQMLVGFAGAYEELHPETTVDVINVGREILGKLMPAMAAGDTVDLVDYLGPEMHNALILSEQTLKMDKYLDSPAYGGGGSWKDDFKPGLLKALVAKDGSVSLIPYLVYTDLLFYDKVTWKSQGWPIPETWEEFLDLCQTIKDTSDLAPITHDCGFAPYNTRWMNHLVERMKGPGYIVKAIEDKTGRTWEDAAFTQSLKMIRELFERDYIIEGCEGFTWPQGQIKLATRDAALLLLGSWAPIELAEHVDDKWEWGAFHFPDIPGGAGSRNDVVFQTVGWAALKDTKVPDLVADFLKFATTIENGQKWADDVSIISSLKGVTPKPELKDVNDAILNVRKSMVPFAGVRAYYPDFWAEVYTKNHNPAFLGEITPEEFVKRMKEDTIKYWQNK